MIMNKIAIFASGSGSNAENIVKYFQNHNNIHVDCILTNKADAFVIERAKSLNIESFVFNRDDFYNSPKVLNYLMLRNIDFIVLAGFLWLVPDYLVKNFPNKIVNIHPALLPKYGGKGMYGMKVHEAVVKAGDSETGISIHYVNDKYDEGDIIFQARCKVDIQDTPQMVAEKIHKLEYQHFPAIIEKLVLS
jgi:phosphoribosylglycinamide formyltransferase 1